MNIRIILDDKHHIVIARQHDDAETMHIRLLEGEDGKVLAEGTDKASDLLRGLAILGFRL